MAAVKKKTARKRVASGSTHKTAPSKPSKNFGTGGKPARPVFIVDGSRTPFLKARGITSSQN